MAQQQQKEEPGWKVFNSIIRFYASGRLAGKIKIVLDVDVDPSEASGFVSELELEKTLQNEHYSDCVNNRYHGTQHWLSLKLDTYNVVLESRVRYYRTRGGHDFEKENVQTCKLFIFGESKLEEQVIKKYYDKIRKDMLDEKELQEILNACLDTYDKVADKYEDDEARQFAKMMLKTFREDVSHIDFLEVIDSYVENVNLFAKDDDEKKEEKK